MKRFASLLALAAVLSLVFAGAAFANFGPHGGYTDDTDACAACHRAHTSFSTVGYVDRAGTAHESALLVGSATSMTEFCNACHGDTAPGASTNVASGIFDSGPSADTANTAPGTSSTLAASGSYPGDGGTAPTLYNTASTFGAPLNGGGFNIMPDPYWWEETSTVVFVPTSSAHTMDKPGPLWGVGSAVAAWPNLSCTNCHDPHGTSNYRLLKGSVNGHTVGGYAADGETPNPFIVSEELNYPLGGWLKHTPGSTQMAAYRPDYTAPKYRATDGFGGGGKSMSVWCSACHERYNVRSDEAAGLGGYNYDVTGTGLANDGPYEQGLVGSENRHRHPVDVNLAAGIGPGRALQEEVKASAYLPLENNPIDATGDFYRDFIGCLTCHRAHGASAEMTGWAAATLTTTTPEYDGDTSIGNGGAFIVMPVKDNVAGVDPDKDDDHSTAALDGTSALLRVDNRGVCERCHNK